MTDPAAPVRLRVPRHPNATNYSRGARFERKVAESLRADGFWVLRAAGSHGKADLIALKPGQVVLVQCKLSGPGGVRPAEWNELWEMASAVDATAVVASINALKRGRIVYMRLIGPKSRPGMRAPALPWTPDEIIGGDE